MDRTHVNLASILVGGAAVFAVFTKFYVPEVNEAHWGENLFAFKHDTIDLMVTRGFAVVFVVGLLLQVWAEIEGAKLPERKHSAGHYLIVSCVGLVLVYLLVVAVVYAGNRVARATWEPRVIDKQTELFERAHFMSTHDGWTREHWPDRDRITQAGNAEAYRGGNLDSIKEAIGDLEQLLEIETIDGATLAERVARLAPFFEGRISDQ